MDVLERSTEADLGGTRILVLAGRDDPFRARSEELATRLRADGAAVILEMVAAAHELTAEDHAFARSWLVREA
jgi:predicted esterase